jgi:hypothetical protein
MKSSTLISSLWDFNPCSALPIRPFGMAACMYLFIAEIINLNYHTLYSRLEYSYSFHLRVSPMCKVNEEIRNIFVYFQ